MAKHTQLPEDRLIPDTRLIRQANGTPFVFRKITAGDFSKTGAMKKGERLLRPLPRPFLVVLGMGEHLGVPIGGRLNGFSRFYERLFGFSGDFFEGS